MSNSDKTKLFTRAYGIGAIAFFSMIVTGFVIAKGDLLFCVLSFCTIASFMSLILTELSLMNPLDKNSIITRLILLFDILVIVLFGLLLIGYQVSSLETAMMCLLSLLSILICTYATCTTIQYNKQSYRDIQASKVVTRKNQIRSEIEARKRANAKSWARYLPKEQTVLK